MNKRTPGGEAVTRLIMDLFGLNNRMLAAGDRLVAGLGLTSARWQILGTIVAAERPQPVAWLARDMGANRQNVQRIVNDLEKDGLIAFEPNPHHRRAQLVVLTDKGHRTYDDAIKLYDPQVNWLGEEFTIKDIATAGRVMKALRKRFEDENAGGEN